jgi:hypothetical protein
MDDCINLNQKVSAHTDSVVIGFGVEAVENKCESEDGNDAEDIDDAIDADTVDNHFFDRCVDADSVTNDNDFSDDGRRTSHMVFCSSSTTEKKRRVIAIIKNWSCDKCTYQHMYHTQLWAMCNANCNDKEEDGNATMATKGAYSSSSSARSETTTTLKREWSLVDVKDTNTRLIGTSESARSYTPRALAQDQAPALTHLLGMSKSELSYTLHALASVTNLSPRKKKLRQSQLQSSRKENWGSDVNMVSLQIPPSKMATKPRAVSLSPEDIWKTFEQHYPQAHGPIKSHGDLFFKITGVKAYSTPCPPEKMLEGLIEDGYTKVFSRNYAPPHKEGNSYGYVGKDSRALDHTNFFG